jgi:hypothetical protein
MPTAMIIGASHGMSMQAAHGRSWTWNGREHPW